MATFGNFSTESDHGNRRRAHYPDADESERAILLSFGSARMTDFDPGDYVNVQATQDMNGYYWANTITETRKGTPQERAAAEQPLNVSMHAGNGQSTQSSTQGDSGDSSRPVLHRAGDSGSGSGSSDSGSTDSARPQLRRADSASTDDSSSASSGSTGNSGDSTSSPRRSNYVVG